ncbi:aquaporin family protein [Synechococcus elongatus]|uniref:MIP family channel proteins n=3 Tax=Synechococcus elongatus TaxID=32046 RepID=Q79PG0_SYNE7|nr:aquaporin family protein [Synechococcus elongatus]AJD57944.1 major intrinsic protein [Synechococcus elongatus UTEX 2973]MBD2588408.1 aquaporin family protein [Synechococcus elongatus FACHB-242]UOW71390.1 aquaporin Z [Synechococcus elongatus PCC 7943]UOW74063.1 aquaporin Z [Synechococcus elongatus PCC 6311]prf//2120231A pore-forming membrane protein [Synechococcus sp.]
MKMLRALKHHWPEYLIEAWGLGLFMVAAGVVGTLVFYPQSPAYQAIADPFLQRVVMGLGMGLTAMIIMYSPWGKRSGAHINPAVTLTFYRLKKIAAWDAFFYVVFQFIGGLLGVVLVAFLLQTPFTQAPVNYVVTVPGKQGAIVACIAEYFIAVLMMSMVLFTSNQPKLERFTPFFAGCLIVSYVIFESPLSGFGMNPARTVASALPSGIWTAIWLYFLAPIAGMLTAAELYLRMIGPRKIFCAKLYHDPLYRCIHCGHLIHWHRPHLR